MRYKSFFLVLLSCGFICLSAVDTLFISLGHDCKTAEILRTLNLRKDAYPFDWIGSIDFNGIYKCFETDFSDYFLKNNLKMLPLIYDVGLQGYYNRILDDAYGFTYNHDFPLDFSADMVADAKEEKITSGKIVTNFLDFHHIVYAKYQRRVNRLRDALRSTKKIFLIRTSGTYQEAKRLSSIIREKYPICNFTLVIVSSEEEAKYQWNLAYVKNFYIPSNIPINVFNKEELGPWVEIINFLYSN